ncbi:DUF378 domain-containing protein [Priestia endophytica]|uniref:DUF378 domain-containing protein n=1 Tax=Priestia endophytica TaxID=135735 RepID=UPI00227F8E61|nr:DUF378 domain-containing protein [Priestia endophytica]MCY8231743.1 DUF378 domain-containing protein [Priestia endophytica]
MTALQKVALVLIIIGAINWGLVGLFQFDLVATLFDGSDTVLSRIVYVLVAISGLINIGLLFKSNERVTKGSQQAKTSY